MTGRRKIAPPETLHNLVRLHPVSLSPPGVYFLCHGDAVIYVGQFYIRHP
jgi:hypothetical protein